MLVCLYGLHAQSNFLHQRILFSKGICHPTLTPPPFSITPLKLASGHCKTRNRAESSLGMLLQNLCQQVDLWLYLLLRYWKMDRTGGEAKWSWFVIPSRDPFVSWSWTFKCYGLQKTRLVSPAESNHALCLTWEECKSKKCKFILDRHLPEHSSLK